MFLYLIGCPFDSSKSSEKSGISFEELKKKLENDPRFKMAYKIQLQKANEYVKKVLDNVKIPVAIKISKYFTRLGLSVKALSESGVAGIVLFNRFYTPDIDIDKIAITSANMFSTPEEQYETLRWTAIMSEKIDCDLAASTGIHKGEDVVKMLLAGANVTQIASTLYKNGPDQISRILTKLEKWMTDKGFDSLDQFRGMIARMYGEDPAAFERMQFMKNFSEIN